MKQNWENNLVEYDGIWYIKGKDGNCEKFIMSDLKKIIQEAKQEERERIKKITETELEIWNERIKDKRAGAFAINGLTACQNILGKLNK